MPVAHHCIYKHQLPGNNLTSDLGMCGNTQQEGSMPYIHVFSSGLCLFRHCGERWTASRRHCQTGCCLVREIDSQEVLIWEAIRHPFVLLLFATGGWLKQHLSGMFKIFITSNSWLQGKTITIFHVEDKISRIQRQNGGAKAQPLRMWHFPSIWRFSSLGREITQYKGNH